PPYPPLSPISFGLLPKLHTLELNQLFPEDAAPWSQIRKLQVQDWYNNVDIDKALTLCSGLESLSFETASTYFPHYPKPVTAPPHRLHQSDTVISFALHGTGNAERGFRDVESLLGTLKFPSLTTLSVQFDYHGQNAHFLQKQWPHLAFISFISPCTSSITSLTLFDIPVRSYELIEILQLSSNLTHLAVQQTLYHGRGTLRVTPMKSRLNMEFIQALICSQPRSLVKQLTNIILHVSSDWFNDSQIFVEVVRSRCYDGCNWIGCLKSVELHLLDVEVTESLLTPLQALQIKGLKLDIRGAKDL
ncbi:hypothetical protein BT96DRAFT_952277, partial [Gymnopus androsaceus JB14]